MYPEPDDNIRPVPPVRAEFAHNPQEEHLLPQIPERMDKPGQNSSTISRQVIEEITDAALQRVNLIFYLKKAILLPRHAKHVSIPRYTINL
jgi:hypothetical protein